MSQLLQITDPSLDREIQKSTEIMTVGIDLGTTHTLVSIIKNGAPIILGDHLIPSIVYAHNDLLIAGNEALDASKSNGNEHKVLRSVKRFMGRETTGMPLLAELNLSPVEVSAAILRKAKSHAELILGCPVNQAVITVPAYFNGAQRQATKDAARLAGIDVLRLLSEPTAAALAYGLDQNAEGTYAVYDLGGGTFDFSLLRLEKGVFQVLATQGDTHLGGDDVDQLILNHLSALHSQRIDHSYLPVVRTLKEELSYVRDVTYEIQGCQGTLTADAILNLVDPLINRTLECVDAALRDAGKTVDQVDGVILAGGATRMPHFHRAVAEYFKKQPLMSMNPDHIVALGAAHQAHQLTHGSDNLLLDVTPLSLGVEMLGGVVERLIERNTPVPIQKTKKFTTAQDGQTGLMLHIVQGEREFAADCRSLAQLELKGIPPLKAGVAKIALTFTLDADGLLTVLAQEETTGISQEVMVKPTYGLSESDMIEMLRKSSAVAEEDMNQRLLVESRLAGKGLLAVVMQALQEDASILLPESSETILKAMDTLEATMQMSDREAIEDAIKHLNQVTHTFAEDRMGHRLSQALGGKKVKDVNDDLSLIGKID